MNFNPWTFLFEIFNFLVLTFVLHRLLYRPLREAVERRQQDASRARQEAEEMRRAAMALQQEAKQHKHAQEQERQSLLQKAHEQAEGERMSLLAEAERVVRERQEKARQDLERERAEARNAMQQEAAAQALELARRLLAESADRSLNDQLARRLGQTLHELSPAEREKIRDEWQPEDGAVLESADAVNGTVLRDLAESAAAVLGKPVSPEVRVRPELIAGCRLRLGSHVWDATFAGPLQTN